MISSEEVGTILARLVIADEAFLQNMLLAGRNAGGALLLGDMEKLETWARLMKALRASITANTQPNNDNQE